MCALFCDSLKQKAESGLTFRKRSTEWPKEVTVRKVSSTPVGQGVIEVTCSHPLRYLSRPSMIVKEEADPDNKDEMEGKYHEKNACES